MCFVFLFNSSLTITTCLVSARMGSTSQLSHEVCHVHGGQEHTDIGEHQRLPSLGITNLSRNPRPLAATVRLGGLAIATTGAGSFAGGVLALTKLIAAGVDFPRA